MLGKKGTHTAKTYVLAAEEHVIPTGNPAANWSSYNN